MALSGYPSYYYSDSTNMKVPVTPNLKLIINETNNQLINNYMNHLFHVQEDFFNKLYEESKKIMQIEWKLIDLLKNEEQASNQIEKDFITEN